MIDFEIEQGEFGPRLVLKSVWDPYLLDLMLARGIKELNVNYAKGFNGADVHFLKDLPFLQGLLLIAYNITDISDIHLLHDLRSLTLGSPAKTELDFTHFPLLERCSLSRSFKANGMFECTGLTDLYVNPYTAKDTTQFAKLVNLESLCIGQSDISTLKGFEGLTKIKKLGLYLMKQLSSLRGIEALNNLEELDIDTCKKLMNIDEIRHLTNLRKLSLANCGTIDSLEPVSSLVKLEAIYFPESTNIADGNLLPLTKLPYLKRIAFANRRHYSHNRTVNFDGLIKK